MKAKLFHNYAQVYFLVMLFMIVFHLFLNSQDKKNGPKRNAQFHFAYNTEILLGKVIVLFISATGDGKDLAL